MSKRNFKRVLITSDTHCGHRAGLTPPGWFYSLKDASPARKEWGKLQRECWKFYSSEIKSYSLLTFIFTTPMLSTDEVRGVAAQN